MPRDQNLLRYTLWSPSTNQIVCLLTVKLKLLVADSFTTIHFAKSRLLARPHASTWFSSNPRHINQEASVMSSLDVRLVSRRFEPRIFSRFARNFTWFQMPTASNYRHHDFQREPGVLQQRFIKTSVLWGATPFGLVLSRLVFASRRQSRRGSVGSSSPFLVVLL